MCFSVRGHTILVFFCLSEKKEDKEKKNRKTKPQLNRASNDSYAVVQQREREETELMTLATRKPISAH